MSLKLVKSKSKFIADVKKRPVSSLVLPIRAQHCLESSGIQTIGELLETTPEEFIRKAEPYGVGRKTLEDIGRALYGLGFSWHLEYLRGRDIRIGYAD